MNHNPDPNPNEASSAPETSRSVASEGKSSPPRKNSGKASKRALPNRGPAILRPFASYFNIIFIAVRSIMQRGVASALTMTSMGLGIMLVVIVLTLHGIISESFRANSSVGYNMVIGARGGSMQLALNSVYYLSKPIETIPYEYYLAFQDQSFRATEIENSVINRTQEANRAAFEIQSSAAPLTGFGGPASMVQLMAEETLRMAEAESIGAVLPGKLSGSAEYAIPLCLGDYYTPDAAHDYRVVATTPDFVDKIKIDPSTNETLTIADGRNFKTFSEENGYFECVVGSIIARRHDLKVGQKLNPTHGAPDGSVHENGFKIVGILNESKTPNDRIVLINIEGFYLMEKHAKPLYEGPIGGTTTSDSEAEATKDSAVDDEDDWDDDAWGDAAIPGVAAKDAAPPKNPESDSSDTDFDKTDTPPSKEPLESEEASSNVDPFSVIYQEPLPVEQRELTAILIRTAGIDPEVLARASEEDREFLKLSEIGNAMVLETQINEGELGDSLDWSPFRPARQQTSAQSISPVKEINTLFSVFVAPVQTVFLFLTIMICVVAGLSILVSIYNSMNERRTEIAVMRALGARRGTILMIILTETMIVSLVGGVIGWAAAHGLNAMVSPFVEETTGVTVGFFDMAPPFQLLPDSSWIGPISLSQEWILVPGLVVLSTLVGLYPALTAYRTDVAKALSS